MGQELQQGSRQGVLMQCRPGPQRSFLEDLVSKINVEGLIGTIWMKTCVGGDNGRLLQRKRRAKAKTQNTMSRTRCEAGWG